MAAQPESVLTPSGHQAYCAHCDNPLYSNQPVVLDGRHGQLVALHKTCAAKPPRPKVEAPSWLDMRGLR